MKTKLNAVFSARFGALLGFMGMMVLAPVSAQTVELVAVEKFSDYQQTEGGITQATNPYGFAVFVEGTGDFSGISASFAPPVGSAESGAALEPDGDSQLSYEVPFASQTALDTAFGHGTYLVTVNSEELELSLPSSAFPNTPMVATFSQGFWSVTGDVFYFDPTQDLTITTNAFTAYGDNLDALIEIEVWGTSSFFEQGVEQFHDADGGNDFLSLTILASTVDPGEALEMEIGFISIFGTDTTITDPLLQDTLIASVYSTFTFVQLQAIPEPSTYAMLVGGAGLALAVWVRRRRR